MKKTIPALTLVLLCFASLAGTSVAREEVIEIGGKWLRNAFPEAPPKLIETTTAVEQEGMILYYILSARDGGWVLVAADDAAMPILAYSDTGRFEYPITCPATAYWVRNYEEQIAEAILGQFSNRETRPAWDQILAGNLPQQDGSRAVSPLCATTWNQNHPYNNYCPSQGGITAYAGCVATAMAQVMKKWNWPPQGVGMHSYQDGSTYLPNYGTLGVSFNIAYNWASMPNSISAVDPDICTLIYHCGVSVDTDYGSAASAALVFTNDAMEKFFSYDPAAQWLWRYPYSDATWDGMMKGDLDLGRPIVYQGYNASNTTGHSFVMDGYDNNSPTGFHFNFGWGGAYDGYFTLNNLVPVSGTDFSYFQWAYYNIQPGVNVAGTIRDASSNPLPNVSVSFSGAGTAVTDASGFYSLPLPMNYSGTATPALSGYTFNPSSRTYTNITTLYLNQDYTGALAVPADPSNAVATAVGYDTVQLTWTDNSNNETGFSIDCKLVTDLNWYFRGTAPANANSFVDFGLMPLQTYIYRVTAFNGAGNSNPAISNQVTTLAPPPPSGLWTPSVNFTDAWLQWTENGSTNVWDIEFGPPGFTPGTGIYLPLIPNNPFNLQGLQQGTPYDWYVRSFYPGVNVYSSWAGPGSFVTQGTPTLPYPWFENLEAGFVNMVSDPASQTPWLIDTTLCSEGAQSAWNAYQANNTNMLTTTYTFSLATAVNPMLYFHQIAKTENNWDHCYVEISPDGGLSWMILMPHEYLGSGNYVPPAYNNPEGPCFMESSYPEWGTGNTVPDNSWWKPEMFSLQAYLGQPNVMLRFRLKSDGSAQRHGWHIDDVRVMEAPQYDFAVDFPPDGYLLAGGSVDYTVTIRNLGAQPDNYNPALQGMGALNYTLYEMDGSTLLPATVNVPPFGKYQFIMRATDTGLVAHRTVDHESLSVISATTGTGFVRLFGTTYLLGDTAGNPIVINALPYTDSFSTAQYNHDYGPYGVAGGLVNLLNPITGYYSGTLTLGSSKDVVYQLTLSQPTLLSVDLAGSSYDTALAVVTSPGTNPGDVLLIDDDGPTQVSYVDSGCNYVPAGTCFIVIGGYSAATGNYVLNVVAYPPPVQPAVTIQLDTTNNQVILTWAQNTVMTYDVYSDTNPVGSYSTQEASNLNAGSLTISPIPSPMMFYRVVEKFCFPAHAKDSPGTIDPFKKE